MTGPVEVQLIVDDGSGQTRHVPVERLPFLIGRSTDCQCYVRSHFVSRRHARIEAGKDGLAIVDLRSRNGTTLNGAPLVANSPTPLRDGDCIGMGPAQLWVVANVPDTNAGERVAMERQIVVDPVSRTVLVNGRPPRTQLSPLELELLLLLWEHRDRCCRRDQILERLWGTYPDGRPVADPNMLHGLVHSLRARIEPNPTRPRILVLVPRLGYRLVVEAERGRTEEGGGSSQR